MFTNTSVSTLEDVEKFDRSESDSIFKTHCKKASHVGKVSVAIFKCLTTCVRG